MPFAAELFRDVKLFGRPLKMQNRETGVGMGGGGGGHGNHRGKENKMAHSDLIYVLYSILVKGCFLGK